MSAKTEIKPDHGGIYAALAAAQMQMGKALKSSENKHFSSKYADLSAVLDACLPALNGNGIAVMQPIREVDGKMFAVTVLAHASGETMECPVPLIVQKNDMQGLGSAITYARRYGLMSMAGIAPEDDDGNAAAAAAPDPRAEFEADVASAIRGIEGERDIDGLGEFWADLYRRQRKVADDRRVVDAKNKRKVALSQTTATDLGGDEIPY